jgi:hypothetical protein
VNVCKRITCPQLGIRVPFYDEWAPIIERHEIADKSQHQSRWQPVLWSNARMVMLSAWTIQPLSICYTKPCGKCSERLSMWELTTMPWLTPEMVDLFLKDRIVTLSHLTGRVSSDFRIGETKNVTILGPTLSRPFHFACFNRCRRTFARLPQSRMSHQRRLWFLLASTKSQPQLSPSQWLTW